MADLGFPKGGAKLGSSIVVAKMWQLFDTIYLVVQCERYTQNEEQIRGFGAMFSQENYAI